MPYDIAVIGSGPAGLSAAINARARGKTVLVVGNDYRESPLYRAEQVDNYLGLPGKSGAELLELCHRHAEEMGAAFRKGRVLNVMPAGDRFYLGIGSDVEEAGAVVLENRTASIRSGEGGFTLLGLSDENLTDGTLGELMEGVPAGELAVLLAHQPQHWDRYAAAGADLVCSGHAHGGQARLPLGGGMFAPGQGVLPELTEGVHTAGGSALVISRGLGNSVFPLRLFNRPEVVALTLRAE